MKKIVLTITVVLALVRTALCSADISLAAIGFPSSCAYTAGGGGSWSPWQALPSGDRVSAYTCGSCYNVLNATYCSSFSQSPTLIVETYVDGQGWVTTPPTGGNCIDHGIKVCPIGGPVSSS